MIKQYQDINDAMIDILTTGMHEDSEWTVKIIMKKKKSQKNT